LQAEGFKAADFGKTVLGLVTSTPGETFQMGGVIHTGPVSEQDSPELLSAQPAKPINVQPGIK